MHNHIQNTHNPTQAVNTHNHTVVNTHNHTKNNITAQTSINKTHIYMD